MLTYDFHDMGGRTLTDYLYSRIQQDILSGNLPEGEKMPSKRSFAKNLGVSTITVENVYAQLQAEGYLRSEPRRGYYVDRIGGLLVPGGGAVPAGSAGSPKILHAAETEEAGNGQGAAFDLTGTGADKDSFPFTIWAKISRQVLTEKRDDLLRRSPGAGILTLREAVAGYLLQYQGMSVEPQQVIIGAGTEYLYSLLIRLLGPDKVYAVESPGYPKTARIYESNGVKVRHIPMDEHGIRADILGESGADVVHISPSHQFPSGITMPIGRRGELLSWAQEGRVQERPGCRRRYIIEDDYDSEFRLSGRPVPSLMSIDRSGSVIYLNTFTKSLASTIRISYMVLPGPLLARYHEKLGFYSCTVSNFEQYTLAQFIRDGYFEKHINRMRTIYRKKQDRLLDAVAKSPLSRIVRVRGAGAGLHFLMEVDAGKSEEELSSSARREGVLIRGLHEYDTAVLPDGPQLMVVSYAGLSDAQIDALAAALCRAWL